MSVEHPPPGSSEDDDFETEVVGESFRQLELRALDERIGIDVRGRRTFWARLRPDPQNSYDANAVAVLAADNADHLGHLPRELAPFYQSPLLARGEIDVPAILYGGSSRRRRSGCG